MVKHEESTWVYYIHGGLHIEESLDGTAREIVNDGGSVLGQFGLSSEEGIFPLIVTEGRAENKLRAIQDSAYLSFALAQFSISNRPLVIFGHSLGESDDHILAAIRGWSSPRLAI